MAFTGKQKAALLLMSLDPATAGELLKGIDGRIVRELAVELSYLDASGFKDMQKSAEVAKEFCDSLQGGPGFQMKTFLKQMLTNTVGAEKAQQLQGEIQEALEKRDPFMGVRSADVQSLTSVLETEHPQAVAVVLSELPVRRSSEILGKLGEGIRLSAISRMTGAGTVTPEARARIAEMVRRRLQASAATKTAGATDEATPEQSLRKVAVILRNLDKALRDGILGTIQQKDPRAAQSVNDLMVVWEDLPRIADRSLQQALRGVNEQQMALAMQGASDEISRKIRLNISERAAGIIDEEMSLMSAPKKEQIADARDKIVGVLREWNTKGELSFVEE